MRGAGTAHHPPQLAAGLHDGDGPSHSSTEAKGIHQVAGERACITMTACHRMAGTPPMRPDLREAPFPIPELHADAWMVRELREGIPAAAGGRVICARILADPNDRLK